MNRLMLSATATLFAGQALGHSQQLNILQASPSGRWLVTMVIAGGACYVMRRYRRK